MNPGAFRRTAALAAVFLPCAPGVSLAQDATLRRVPVHRPKAAAVGTSAPAPQSYGPLTPSTGPEVNASTFPAPLYPYSETSIAVNPANPRMLVAGANSLGSNPGMVAMVSMDRGASFTATHLPRTIGTTTYASTSDPAVAFDLKGNAYYSFLVAANGTSTYRPVVCILPTGLADWQGPYYATPAPADDDKEYLAVDTSHASPYAGRVYVTWDRNNADGTQNVLLARSDDGRTWQAPVRVDDANSSGYAIYATPATGPTGQVYVVWNDYAQKNAGYLKIDRSLDGGATFGPDVTVTDLRLNLQPDPTNPYSIYPIPAQPQRGIDACPSIGVDITNGPRRGWVYICYNDVAAGKPAGSADTDVFVRHSTDGGQTWSGPVRVNDDATATSQFFPWMSVDPVDGSLNISWYDCRLDPTGNRKTNVYYSRSVDGGTTFESNVKVTTVPSDESTGTGDPAGNDYGDYEGIAALGGQVTPVWTDTREGLNQVYTATLIQPCAPPAGPAQIAAGVVIPAGASLGSRAVTLSATLTGPAESLIPEWEVKPIGTAFNGQGTVLGSAVPFSGAPITIGQPFTGLGNGGYHWRVRARRGDGLGAPGDWASFGSGSTPDFVIGGITYAAADAARALKIAGGLLPATASDMLRLNVNVGATGQKGADGHIKVLDAIRLARAAAGLEAIP